MEDYLGVEYKVRRGRHNPQTEPRGWRERGEGRTSCCAELRLSTSQLNQQRNSPPLLSGVTLLCDLFKGHGNGKFFFSRVFFYESIPYRSMNSEKYGIYSILPGSNTLAWFKMYYLHHHKLFKDTVQRDGSGRN